MYPVTKSSRLTHFSECAFPYIVSSTLILGQGLLARLGHGPLQQPVQHFSCISVEADRQQKARPILPVCLMYFAGVNYLY
jgi:hypothetical protein